MWIFSLLVILYNFIIIFVPIFLDLGIQIWNGVSISQTDFTSRTINWNPAGWENVTELKFEYPFNYEDYSEDKCKKPNYCCRDDTILTLDQRCDGVKNCIDGPKDSSSDEDRCVSVTRLVPVAAKPSVMDDSDEEGSGIGEEHGRRKRGVENEVCTVENLTDLI